MISHVTACLDIVWLWKVLEWIHLQIRIVLRHQLKQITFIGKMMIILYFCIYLILFELLSDLVFSPLSPKEVNLIKMTTSTLQLVDANKPWSSFENLSYYRIVVTGRVGVELVDVKGAVLFLSIFNTKQKGLFFAVVTWELVADQSVEEHMEFALEQNHEILCFEVLKQLILSFSLHLEGKTYNFWCV